MYSRGDPSLEWDSVYEVVEPDVAGAHVQSDPLRLVGIEICVDRPRPSSSVQASLDLLPSSSSRCSCIFRPWDRRISVLRQRLALGIGTGAYLVCFFLPWEFCAQILVLFLFKWDCLVDGVASVILI